MIKRPIFTEKSFRLNALDTFSFKVDQSLTKDQIKRMIKDLYQVDVVSVNTLKLKPLTTRSRKTNKSILKRGYKKALVKLKPGQKIKLFNT